MANNTGPKQADFLLEEFFNTPIILVVSVFPTISFPLNVTNNKRRF
uniref:Uncharacterized protein n=1 Tax=Ascaris lumbricoides TaxID=6252 RepID=A0A0M3IS54_ASCLU